MLCRLLHLSRLLLHAVVRYTASMKPSENAPPIETVAALSTGRTTTNGSSVDLTTVERVQAMVLGWYAAHGRHFVWRFPILTPMSF